MSGQAPTAGVALSIVSHGHGQQVLALMDAVATVAVQTVAQVIVTLNIPEPALAAGLRAREWPFALRLIDNQAPRGFGANHNAAFQACTEAFFCVLNPDIEIALDPFAPLLAALASERAGCAFPRQVDASGKPQDYAREVPTLASLWRRYTGRGERAAQQPVDWVGGACMMFPAGVFRQLGGFDERYFMYCEDVDICLRLKVLGYELSPGNATLIHALQRQSHRDMRHLAWHVSSLVRLWFSKALRDFRHTSTAAARPGQRP